MREELGGWWLVGQLARVFRGNDYSFLIPSHKTFKIYMIGTALQYGYSLAID